MANTLYDDIFDSFYQTKLVNDKEFFSYVGCTDLEVADLVHTHSLNLMNNAISTIYGSGVPQINLYDKDATQFNNELTDIEIGLIVDICYYLYMLEPRNKLKILGLTFKNSELSLFSPSADRDSYEKMLKSIGDDVEVSIQSYLNRDRLTHRIRANNFG